MSDRGFENATQELEYARIFYDKLDKNITVDFPLAEQLFRCLDNETEMKKLGKSLDFTGMQEVYYGLISIFRKIGYKTDKDMIAFLVLKYRVEEAWDGINGWKN